MLALGLSRGLSLFWSPNFQHKPSTNKVVPESRVARKEPKKKDRCKKMRALQRSLSEAQTQKNEVGVDALKELIRTHKANCAKCNSSE